MAHVKHVHSVLENREDYPVASVPSAKDQLAQFILEQSVFTRPRAPLREARERVDLRFDRIEPPLGGIGRLGGDPAGDKTPSGSRMGRIDVILR